MEKKVRILQIIRLSFLITGCVAQNFIPSQPLSTDETLTTSQSDSDRCDTTDKSIPKIGCDTSCNDGEWQVDCPLPSTTGGTGCSPADEPMISKSGCSN